MDKKRQRAAGAIGGVMGACLGAITPQTISPFDNLVTRSIAGAVIGAVTGVIVYLIVSSLLEKPKK